MRTSIQVGRISGIPIRIHFNWVLTAILVTWSLASGYFPQEYPGWTTVNYWLVAGVTAFLFFASVLLHELGHAVLALNEGVPVQSITLFIFGGVAHIGKEPDTPGAEFRIVAAGPFTSLLLAGLFYIGNRMAVSALGFAVFGPLAPLVSAASLYLSEINIILAVFNLIPGFPLDGGRLLRAVLWRLLEDFRRATRWATTAGYGVSALFVLAGLAFMALGNLVGGLWVVFIGGYLGTVARGARQQSDYEEEESRRQAAAFAGDLSPPTRPAQSRSRVLEAQVHPHPFRAARLVELPYQGETKPDIHLPDGSPSSFTQPLQPGYVEIKIDDR